MYCCDCSFFLLFLGDDIYVCGTDMVLNYDCTLSKKLSGLL